MLVYRYVHVVFWYCPYDMMVEGRVITHADMISPVRMVCQYVRLGVCDHM